MFLCVYANNHRERQARRAIVCRISRIDTSRGPVSNLMTSWFPSRALRPCSCSNLGLVWPAVKKFVYDMADTNLMVRDILSNLQYLAVNLVVGWSGSYAMLLLCWITPCTLWYALNSWNIYIVSY